MLRLLNKQILGYMVSVCADDDLICRILRRLWMILYL